MKISISLAGLAVCTTLLAACGQKQATPPAPQPAVLPPGISLMSVSITANGFDPPALAVKPGTTIVWINQDTKVHTVTIDGAPDSGSIAPGKTFSHTFAADGSYSYHDSIGHNMTGTVKVQ